MQTPKNKELERAKSLKQFMIVLEDLDLLKGWAGDNYTKWVCSIDRMGYNEYEIVDVTQDVEALFDYLSTAAAQTSTNQHPDDLAVDQFAKLMKLKLAACRAKGRGGWETASAELLSSELYKHLFDKKDLVDVANFAMMLQQNGQQFLPLNHNHE
jgi:hypothetical protein